MPIFSASLSSRLALLDMGFEISDVPPAFGRDARPAGKADLAQRFTHGLAVVAVAGGVDIRFGDGTDIGPAAEKTAEMAFLVAPCCDLDRAMNVRIRIDDAGGFERIDHAERSIEPARIVLAFQMRARQQFRPGLRAGSDDVADAVDFAREVRLGEPLRQPLERAHMRFRERRLVNAGLVGADGAERIEIGKDASTIHAGEIVSHQLACLTSDPLFSGVEQSS